MNLKISEIAKKALKYLFSKKLIFTKKDKLTILKLKISNLKPYKNSPFFEIYTIFCYKLTVTIISPDGQSQYYRIAKMSHLWWLMLSVTYILRVW